MSLSSFRASLAALAVTLLLPVMGAQAADYTLSLSTSLDQKDPLFKGLEAFKAAVERRSEGKIEINLFASSQLGKDEDLFVTARAGAPIGLLEDGGRLAVFVPEFGILGAPFLVSGYDNLRKVVTSSLVAGWSEKLRAAAGLQVLSFNWWQGERQLLTNTPITVPSDLKGIRIRTIGAPVWMEAVRALGGKPTPMPWTETYDAIEQGVIGGAEAQLPAVYGARLYEVTKYLTKTGHINLITGIVVSAAWYDTLPSALRQVLTEEALAAGDKYSHNTETQTADFEQKLKDNGMQISTPDLAAFQSAAVKVYEKLGYSDLRVQVNKVITDQ